MKIVGISNLQGYLPKELPCGDVLVIAGGILPYNRNLEKEDLLVSQTLYWHSIFRPWLSLQTKIFNAILITYGYTDYLVERAKDETIPNYIKNCGRHNYLPGKIYNLFDRTIVIDGVKFYGSPWSREGCTSYAFHKQEHELAREWQKIPYDVNVLITHEAPLNMSSRFFGSQSLLDRTKSLTSLKCHFYGHNHYYCTQKIDNITYINCSFTKYSTDNKMLQFIPNNYPVPEYNL